MHYPRIPRALAWALPLALLLLLVIATLTPRQQGDETSSANRSPGQGSPHRPATAPASSAGSPSSTDTGEAIAATDPAAIPAFDHWLTRFTAADAAARSTLLPEGLAFAEERRIALKELIAEDPQAALAAAVDYETRKDLPSALLARLEEPVHHAGAYEVEITCFDALNPGGRMTRRAIVDEREFEVFTFGRRLDVTTKDTLSLHGIAIDDRMTLSDDPVRVLGDTERADRGITADGIAAEVRGRIYLAANADALSEVRAAVLEGEIRPGHNAAAGYAALDAGKFEHIAYFGEEEDPPAVPEAASPRTEGDKTMLYIRCRLSDDAPGYEPVSDANAASRQAVVESYWEANSYGKSTLATTITTVLDLPQDYDFYRNNSLSNLRNDAIAAAIAANPAWDQSLFDFYTVITRGGWPYSGVAVVGGRWSHLVPGGTQSGIAAHEFGHNLGFGHSNFWLTDSPSPIGADSAPGGFRGDNPDEERIEYGHRFDLMGSAGSTDAHNGRSHYAASGKVLIDWLVEADGDITTLTSSGTARLYRQDITQADLGSYTPNVARAVKIDVPSDDYVNTGDPRRYWLTYRTQPTNGVSQTWLPHGIQVDWVRNGKPNQAVQIDMSPYSQDNPTSTANKEDGVLVVGRTYSDEAADIHFTAVAEGGASPDQWLDVVVNIGTQAANTPPTASLSADFLQVTTGQTVNFTITDNDADGDTLAYWWDFDDGSLDLTSLNSSTASHSWSTAGYYTVRATVSDMKGGRSVQSVVIQVGTPADSYTISGRALQGGLPVADALIKLDGDAATWTLSDGSYQLNGLAAGNYTVEAFRLNAALTPQFTNPVVLSDLNAFGADFFADGGLGAAGSVLAVTPHTLTVPQGVDVQFSASAWDSSGNPVATTPGWSTTGGGTIDGAGLFSATTVGGPFTVTATDGPLTDDAFVTIVDTAALGLETLDGTAIEGSGDTATIRVHRYGDKTGVLDAIFTVTGTATEGSDFNTLGTTVPIPDGSAFVDLVVTGLNDFEIESTESITVTLVDDAAYSIYSPQARADASLEDDGLDIAPQVTLVSPSASAVNVIEGNGLVLSATATDDGLPNPPGTVSAAWSVVSAPVGGGADFSPPDAFDSVATFTAPGIYQLRVTGSDGVNADTADLEVFVATYPWAPPSTTDQVIYYAMDEGTGTTANDGIAPAHDGTLASGAGWTAAGGGVSGTGVVLDGNNDQIDIADSNDINTANVDYRTIAIWFKADDPTKAAKQVIYEEGGAGKGLNIYLHAGMLYIGGWNDGSNGWNTTFLGTPFNDTGWHHVALVLDSAEETTLQPDAFFGYLDGVEFGRGSASRLGSHTGNIAIGARRDATSYHDGDVSGSGDRFDGCVDEFYLWNRSLSASEIRSLSLQNGSVPRLALNGSTTTSGALVIPSGVGLVLDGSVVDGMITSTEWMQAEGPVSGVASFANTTSPATTVTFNQPGYYALRLQADAPGQSVVLPVPIHVGIDTAANPATTNEIIYYALEEGTGTTATDGVGGDHNGTIVGGPSWTAGISGQALQFDGSDDQIDIADSSDINSGTHDQRTIAFWFKADQPESATKQVLFEEGGATKGLNLYLHENRLYIGGWNNGGNGWGSTFLSTSLTDNDWHHVVLVLDAPGATTLIPGAFRGYLDGVEFGRVGASQLGSHTGDIAIGAKRGDTEFHDGNSGGDGNRFAGCIDEFHLFNDRVLSIDEIGLLYSFGNIAPDVDAGPDQPSIPGLAATLSGSRSDDGNGSAPLTQSWSVEATPPGGNVVLSDPDVDGIETSALASLSGTYTLRLSASDGTATTFDEIALTFSVAEAYDVWMAGYPAVLPSERGYLFDPDDNGYTNLEMYGYGGAPIGGQDLGAIVPGSAMVEDGGSTYLEIVFRRRLDAAARGLTYTPVFSPDLRAGSWSGAGGTEMPPTPIDAEFEEVTVRFDTPAGSSNPRHFGTVRIEIAD